MDQNQSVMVIVGGNRGIGAATARLAAAQGWRVVLTSSRPDPAAQALAQVGGGGQVIGMGMGFQQPVHHKPLLLDVSENAIGRPGIGARGFRVIAEHRIDDGAGAIIGFMQDIGVGRRRLVQKGFDQR